MEFFDACRSEYMHLSPPLAWYAFCHPLQIALVYNQADGTRVFFFIRLSFLFLGRNISISSPGDLPEVVLLSRVP